MSLDDICILYIDGGTTRTRGWAAVGERVIATARVSVGARDTAREGSPRRLAEALGHLARRIDERCRAQGQPGPALAVAAGMITSSEGLREVPHVEAPADAADLARGAQSHDGPPPAAVMVCVPGVRCGPTKGSRDSIGDSDVMRGEEVLALGLTRRGRLAGGGVLLSLGSHWKALRLDAHGRIARSVSTLAGEMVQAVRSQTILASVVPRDWPPDLPLDWVEAGLRRGRRDGLPRALYCVRLLDQRTPSTAVERLAFLVGTMIAANEDVLLPPAGAEVPAVVLAGAPSLMAAWGPAIRERGLEPVALAEADREAAFRAGCRAVLEAGDLVRTGGSVGWRPPA